MKRTRLVRGLTSPALDDGWMSSSSSPLHGTQRMSPFRQQQLLIRRLSSTHQHQKKVADRKPPDAVGNKIMGSDSSSNKRPFPSMVRSSPKIEPDNRASAVSAIDKIETWEEVSAIIPLLTYGEESDALLSALLNFSTGDSPDQDGGCVSRKCEKCEGRTAADNHIRGIRLGYLHNLDCALEFMLRTRNSMRRRAHAEAAIGKTIKSAASTPPPKKQRRAEGNVSSEILPWNVLLRITVRLASHVASQLSLHPVSIRRCECPTEKSTKSTPNNTITEEQNDATNEPTSTMHPILQALDIVSADLHMLSRVQRQQKESASNTGSGTNPTATPTRQQGLCPNRPSSQSRIRGFKPRLPRDSFLRDWKSSNECHLTNDIGREVWGSSRYAFLKDIESITKMLELEAISISANEWHGRVDSIVASLDECARADVGNNSQPHETARGAHQQQRALGISPSLLRYGTKNPPKSPPLASITRAHVDRIVRSNSKSERKSCKKEQCVPSREPRPDSIGSICVNLQSTMEKESNKHLPIEADTDELENAYRMAIEFVSARGESEDEPGRKIIERRLNRLVQQVNDTTAHDGKCGSLNIGGAQSYLESLLRTLVQPSEPLTWLRLMGDSCGIETPMMLRRGRTLLVSFLVGIKAPGWEEARKGLESSPVSSYLGYLSPRENNQSSSMVVGREHWHHMNDRQSCFLPTVEKGNTTLPPSPMVTEVGLSLCVKKFLHNDTPKEYVPPSCQPPSSRSSGVSLFRKFGPLQYSNCSSNGHENALASVMSPLPDANELTTDLFDLTLRFAADDDSGHKQKPFSLQLVTPSALESLNVILQVVSDHLDWLSPQSISSRYRFILQRIIQTSGEDSLDNKNIDLDSGLEGFISWAQQSSHIIHSAKMANCGRMALYATQIMMLLCSRNRLDMRTPFSSTRQTHLFACLQLRQSSHFWKEMDKIAIDFPSNIMARILNQSFCARLLLPLSFKCVLLLATSSFQQGANKSTSSLSQGSQSTLSLLAILSSVLDVLANNGFLSDCIHVGWAIQMLSFSISHFVFGEDYNWRERDIRTLSECNTSNDSMWEYISCQLHRLYCNVWGRHGLTDQISSKECTVYESTGDGCIGSRVVILMPSFDIFLANLIKFVCHNMSAESNGVRHFSQYVANIVFDRYAQALETYPYPKKGCHNDDHSHQNEFSLVASWIHSLASNLQEIVCYKKVSDDDNRKQRCGNSEEASTEKVLIGLITPVMRSLHLHITQRVMHPASSRCQNMPGSSHCKSSSDCVASVLVDLYKQEADKFLKKPAPAKTRRWGVYRKCLEKIFTMTPPGALFACHRNSNLMEHSADVLHSIWNQYGHSNLSHSISIMVAAGLHVNSCATCLAPDTSLKLQLKTFSSCAKNCIINAFECFGAPKNKNSQDESYTDVNVLIRFVRRDLSFHRGAEIGVAWWNDISVNLFHLMKKSNEQALQLKQTKNAVSNTDIGKAFLTLQNNLSAISD
mmetsp:Transcript_38290/g.92360  ORF Transcript_38290/g.92360 Transcript_38290/m.92360 type:complete len:1482 (-) Transcript_38290:9-4454(-)